jgi:hypothetical protein
MKNNFLSTAKTLTKNNDFDIRSLLLGIDSNCFRRREGRWLEVRIDCRGWTQVNSHFTDKKEEKKI